MFSMVAAVSRAALAAGTSVMAVNLLTASPASSLTLADTRGGVPNQMCINLSQECEYSGRTCGNPYRGYVTCAKGKPTDECNNDPNSACGDGCTDLLPAAYGSNACSN
jgi:hypothetical protein